MMEYQIAVVTAPAIEPVSLEETRLALRVDASDEDSLLSGLIAQARRDAERMAARAFINRTLAMLLSGWPTNGVIELPYPPAVSVTAISYVDGNGVTQTVASNNYTVLTETTPGRIFLAPNGGWPSDLRALWPIRIQYVAGYGPAAADVPADYRQLIIALVGIAYQSRDELTADAERKLANIEARLKMDWGWA